MTAPFWITAFLDRPAADFDGSVAFWEAVTGHRRGPCWCGQEEFADLMPAAGDPVLGLQRLGSGPARLHLDVHVTDPAAEAGRLTSLGAVVVPQAVDRGYVTMTSPRGMVFCLVAHPMSTRPAPTAWPGGHTSLVDQVCLDIPPSAYDEERAFWAAVTGLAPRPLEDPDLDTLETPPEQPLRLLFQRLRDEQPAVTAHLDLAASDRDSEVARHLALGAEPVGPGQGWVVLRDPAGAAYCVTRRDPLTGGR